MKERKLQNLFSMMFFVTMLLLIPIIGYADIVSWDTQQYTAYASNGSSNQTSYGVPSLAHVGSKFSQPYREATAEITDTSMYAFAYLWAADGNVAARSDFSGTYTAQADTPLFQFTYSLLFNNYNFTQHTYPSADNSAWLTVYDVTDNATLYSNNALSLTSNPSVISVATMANHSISVNFGVESDYYSEGSGGEALTLSYGTAVAPEPISSILFVTGGTFLAGRRLLRRKA